MRVIYLHDNIYSQMTKVLLVLVIIFVLGQGQKGCSGLHDCPEDMLYNPETCKCECKSVDSVPPPTTCESPLVWNQEICGCSSCDRTCAAPFELDTEKCKCKCGNLECSSSQRPNRADCTCDDRCPGVSCGELHTLNVNTCRCECSEFEVCPEGEIFNFDTCACDVICGGMTCDPGFTLNPVKCKCKCDIKAKDCEDGQSFNRNTCQCEECAPCDDPNEVQDKHCQCFVPDCAHVSCSEGLTLKTKGKGCECVCEKKKCGRRQRWDADACVCVPRV